MSEILPDTAAAIAFLERWEPEGPWVLTAIDQDKKQIRTATFRPETRERLAEWLHQNNDVRNIYFHVNRVMHDLNKKAERTDIKEVTWLHVDIDPRAGEDIAEERERARRLLQDFSPPPTVIIDSGGGFQGFWRLQDPIPVEGDLTAAEDAKRYNLQLELLLGGDNCHNIDRIMRLPGTVNIPDERKRKKGRTKALARVVEFGDELYPLSSFAKAPDIQQPTQGFSAGTVKISGNIPRLNDVDDLGERVGGWLKVLIVQGHDPDNPGKYPSRSEALFAVVTGLVKAGVEDDIIFSVITDPNFDISKSVLEQKRPEVYATRQIERAHEEVVSPDLRSLNERHAVVKDLGGKCRVISEIFDPSMKRHRVSRQTFDDFRNAYSNIQIQVGQNPKTGDPIMKKLGTWWLEHPLRRTYETLCFAPGQVVEGSYNLWRGFAVDATPGSCEKFLAHVRDNLCNGNEEHYEYVVNWMARAVQHPDTPGEVAIVLRGRMGTGKSMFAREFGKLFGRHFLAVSDPKHLVGSFNSHLRDCVVVFGDEAFFAGDKKHESVLKTLITEPHLTFEAKGVDAETGPNYIHMILASNSNWVVPAGADERRYLVLDVGDERMQDSGYFGEVMAELNGGGREALLHHLLSRDLSEFNVRVVPKTAALSEQKLLSMPPEDEWWYNKLNEGRLLGDHTGWAGEVDKNALFDDFYQYMQEMATYRRPTRTALGKFLKKVCPVGWPRIEQRWVEVTREDARGFVEKVPTRPYFFVFPSLDRLRELWEQQRGSQDWDSTIITEASEPPQQQEAPF